MALMALLKALVTDVATLSCPTLLKKALKLPAAALPLVEPNHTLRMLRILSWKSVIENNGIETEVIMKGLGEIDGIARLFAEHLKEAQQI